MNYVLGLFSGVKRSIIQQKFVDVSVYPLICRHSSTRHTASYCRIQFSSQYCCWSSRVIISAKVIPVCYIKLLRMYNFSQTHLFILVKLCIQRHVSAEGVIIRLFVEPYLRYIKYSAHFGIPNSLHLKIHVKLLQYFTCIFKCKLFGIPKCALYLMYLRYGSTDSLMMTPSVETCRYMHNLTTINRCV